MVFLCPALVNAENDAELSMEIKDHVATVMQKDTILLKVPLRQEDQGFLAGHCLLVQRDLGPGSFGPYSAKQGDVYDAISGKHVILTGAKAQYWGGRMVVSPSAAWAVMMREYEGILMGYFFLAQDCSITEYKLEKQLFGEALCGAKTWAEPSLGTDGTITLPPVRENNGPRCFSLTFHPDGSHQMSEVSMAPKTK